MRIRDYIRDDPLMGQKRDNKSGLQGGEFSLWFAGAKSSCKTYPRTSQISGIRQKQASSVR
ncbi:hypothetical protein [Pantoea agglomerans]|uniref:hypothetical protein n=1 Tax=Enterobacter agglomerans TaxID=549 RepID=UPI003DA045B8